MTTTELNIAEIAHENGRIKYRYARYLAADGKSWVRHGLFRAYHTNGELASEGQYEHGAEHGTWRDYHENGHRAAEGEYDRGEKVAGSWRYWDQRGNKEST